MGYAQIVIEGELQTMTIKGKSLGAGSAGLWKFELFEVAGGGYIVHLNYKRGTRKHDICVVCFDGEEMRTKTREWMLPQGQMDKVVVELERLGLPLPVKD